MSRLIGDGYDFEIPDDDEEIEEHDHDLDDPESIYCFAHHPHWRDDLALIQEAEGPIDRDRLHPMSSALHLLSHLDQKQKIGRFAFVYATGEGEMQVVTNPGMSFAGITNLLSKAISIMAIQQVIDEKQMAEMQQTVVAGLAKTMAEGSGLPPELMAKIAAAQRHATDEEFLEERTGKLVEDVKRNDNTAGPYL